MNDRYIIHTYRLHVHCDIKTSVTWNGWWTNNSILISTVAVSMAKVASDVKAADIRVLFVKPLVYWTRFFIIATAFSRPQIDAIGYYFFGFLFSDCLYIWRYCLNSLFNCILQCRSRIRDLAEKKYGRSPSGDVKPNSWTLLDFGMHYFHLNLFT